MDPEVRQDDDRGYDEWKDSVLEQAHELKDEGLITPEQQRNWIGCALIVLNYER